MTRPRDGQPTEGGQKGLPRMTTENSTTPSLHFFRQAGDPKKDQPSPELSVRFHVFASGQEFEEEEGGVRPISIERCRPRFLFCSFVSSERPFSVRDGGW